MQIPRGKVSTTGIGAHGKFASASQQLAFQLCDPATEPSRKAYLPTFRIALLAELLMLPSSRAATLHTILQTTSTDCSMIRL